MASLTASDDGVGAGFDVSASLMAERPVTVAPVPRYEIGQSRRPDGWSHTSPHCNGGRRDSVMAIGGAICGAMRLEMGVGSR